MLSNKNKFIPIILLILLYAACSASVFAQTYNRQLADGVILSQKIIQSDPENSANPEIINIINIDPAKSGTRLQAVISGNQVMAGDATKGRETVSSAAKRLNAAAVVNADFFPFTGDMLNLHITGGELVSEPYSGRIVFGVTSDGKCLLDTLGFDARLKLQDGRWIDIRGINRPRGKNEIVAYTSKFSPDTCTTKPCTETVIKLDAPLRINVPISGTVTDIKTEAFATKIPEDSIILSSEGISSIPLNKWLKNNDKVTFEFTIKPAKTSGWENVVEAVGGGPCLVEDGKIHIDSTEAGFDSSFTAGAHPRTAVGITKDKKIVLVTVDGRQSISRGMSLKQLADLMISLGCVEAANLDGGGSTTMATSIGVLNSPSEGSERPVANGLAVFGNPVEGSYPQITITPVSDPIKSGTIWQFILTNVSTGQPLDSALLEKVVWSTSGGAGFVDQSGRFFAVKARKGKVTAKLGANIVSSPVEVTAGDPVKFSAKIKQDERVFGYLCRESFCFYISNST